jgi:hypothetical protein
MTKSEIIEKFENSPANQELRRKKKKTLTDGRVHISTQRSGRPGSPSWKQTIRFADVSKDGKEYSVRIHNHHITHLNARSV